MKHSKGKEVGIDVGCGFMQNRKFFKTKEYIGIDLDKDRLNKGKSIYSEVETICSRLEDIKELKCDFLLCVQVFNNRHFNIGRTVENTDMLTKMLNSGGSLVFNTGKRNIEYEEEIDALLQKKFQSVKKIRYGRFSAHEVNILFSIFLAFLMFFIPALRTGRQYLKSYYFCEGRF